MLGVFLCKCSRYNYCSQVWASLKAIPAVTGQRSVDIYKNVIAQNWHFLEPSLFFCPSQEHKVSTCIGLVSCSRNLLWFGRDGKFGDASVAHRISDRHMQNLRRIKIFHYDSPKGFSLNFEEAKIPLWHSTWRAGAEKAFPFCPTTERGIIPTMPCRTGCTGDAIMMAEPKKYQSINTVQKLKYLWRWQESKKKSFKTGFPKSYAWSHL